MATEITQTTADICAWCEEGVSRDTALIVHAGEIFHAECWDAMTIGATI